jgi:tRNA(Ile)-lysidine synthase
MILDEVRKTIETYHMLSPGDRVIVGVSGGIDSVGLLSVLHKLTPVYDISLVVAHLNHRLRGQESHRDEIFVHSLARKLNLPFETKSVTVRRLKRKNMTLQEVAREARFSFFESLVQKFKAHRIALGQTADDQAETIVMRFLRGAGLTGLKGIPPVRDEMIIHPLLEVGRAEVEAYLTAEGLPHVEDSSNRKDVYLRNRIRNSLIPILEEYNPNLKSRLGRMGQILLKEEEYLQAQTDDVWCRVARRDRDLVRIDLTRFRRLHQALQFRVLRRAVRFIGGIKAKGITADHVLSLAGLALGARSQAVVHLPGRIKAKRIYDRLEIGKEENPPMPSFNYPLKFPGITTLPEIEKQLLIDFVDRWNVGDVTPHRVFMDSRGLQPPLRVRNYRHGDRFRPFGMGGGKKVKDCFIDWKVPLAERSWTPLVLSGDVILWIVGHRISEDVRITPETDRVIRLEIRGLPPAERRSTQVEGSLQR